MDDSRKLIEHFKRRHWHAGFSAFSQWLTEKIFKLDEVPLFRFSASHTLRGWFTYLLQILQHTRFRPALERICCDDFLHHIIFQNNVRSGFRCCDNLLHGWSYQSIQPAICQPDPPRIYTSDGADGVEACIVHQFSPSIMQDVWRVLAICSTACRVQRHKFSGFGTCSFFVNGRVSEGADEESIWLVLNDAARVWLRTADKRNTREYHGPRMRF